MNNSVWGAQIPQNVPAAIVGSLSIVYFRGFAETSAGIFSMSHSFVGNSSVVGTYLEYTFF